MTLLLDTHALLWWLAGDPRLTERAREAIGMPGEEVFVSAASAWEITTKHRIGKLPGAARLAADVGGGLRAAGFRDLPVTLEDGARAGTLPGDHRDPFDRLLIAQALLRGWALVSNEALFDVFGVQRVW